MSKLHVSFTTLFLLALVGCGGAEEPPGAPPDTGPVGHVALVCEDAPCDDAPPPAGWCRTAAKDQDCVDRAIPAAYTPCSDGEPLPSSSCARRRTTDVYCCP